MNILIVDFEFPEPDRCSGGLRLYQIIKSLTEEGHKLAFISIDYWQIWKRQDESYVQMLRNLGVETFRDGTALSPEGGQFIQGFDPEVAILSKYYMANMLTSYLRVTHPFCKLILDTVDVHFLRERRQGSALWFNTKNIELTACNAVDRVWAITPNDRDAINKESLTVADIHIVPNIHDAAGPNLPFKFRSGIVFVGNYIHEPNKDAVHWFANDILPELRKFGCNEEVSVVGPYEELLPNYEGITKTGYVEDLDTLLQKAKVGIAPLRYGAGMKGKIGSYMCNGLPTVTTPIGAEGMFLEHAETAMIQKDPALFADAITLLCDGEGLWQHISDASAKKVTEWSPAAVKKVIEAAVLFE